MSFENTSAFLTQMIETTQEAPENIGTALKTIIARFTELKENVAGTAESEFDDLDYNKVDIALKSVGISLKDASGQFRNLDEVFLELSQKWNTLDRNTQRYIATIAAGSRQQSRFIALMENYDRTMELIETAQDSAGRSSEQFGKYADSLEYKINRLKTSWEELRISFANSELFKNAIDSINKLVSEISSLDKSQLLQIGVLGVTLGQIVVRKFIETIKKSSEAMMKSYNSVSTSAVSKLNPVTAINNAKTSSMAKQAQVTNAQYNEEIQNLTQTKNTNTAEIENLRNNKRTIIKQTRNENKEEIDQIKKEIALKQKSAESLEKRKQNPNDFFRREIGTEGIDNIIKQRQQEIDQLNKDLLAAEKKREEIIEEAEQNERDIQKLKEENVELTDKINSKEKQRTAEVNAQKEALMDEVLKRKDLTEEEQTELFERYEQQIDENEPQRDTRSTGDRVKDNFENITGNDLKTSAIETGKSAVGNGLTTAISTALIMAVQGADLSTILKTSLKTFAISAISTAADFLLPLIGSFILTPVGAIITAIGGAALIALAIHQNNIKKQKELEKAELDRLESVEEKNKEIQKNSEALAANVVASYKKANEIPEIFDRYEELKDKQYRTSAEEEEFNSLYENITTNYSELVISMDENTKAIEFNSNSVDELAEEYRKQANEDRQTILGNTGQLISNLQFQEEKTNSTIQKLLDINDGENGGINSDVNQVVEKLNALSDDIYAKAGFEDFNKVTLTTIEDLKTYLRQKYDIEDYDTDGLQKALDKFFNGINQANLNLKSERAEQNQKAVSEQLSSYYHSFSFDDFELSDDVINGLAEASTERLLDANSKLIGKITTTDAADKASAGASLESYISSDTQATSKVAEMVQQGFNEAGISLKAFFNEDGIFKQFSDLDEHLKDWVETYQGAEWYDANRETDGQMNKMIEALINQTYQGQWAKKYVPDLEDMEAATPGLQTYAELESKMSELTTQEYANELQKIWDTYFANLEEETQTALAPFFNPGENGNEVQKKFQEIDERLADIYGLDDKTINNLSLQLKQNITSQLDKLEKPKNVGKEIAGAYVQLFESLNTDAQQVLSNVDLSLGTQELTKQSEDYINQLANEGKLGIEKATQVWNAFLNQMGGLLSKISVGKESAQLFRSNLNEEISGFQDKYDVLIKAQQEYQENGKLSSETYFAMLENHMDDYVDITSKGYDLLADKAEQYLVDQAMQPLKELDQQIKDAKSNLNDLRNNASKSITIKTGSGQGSTDISTVSDTDLIKKYKDEKGKQQIDKWYEEGNINDETYEAIQLAVQYNFNSFEELYSGMAEYIAELDKSRPDVWIQTLTTIEESVEMADSRVEDLKEELADLNEELEDNKKEVEDAKEGIDDAIESLDDANKQMEEANQQLYEAIHGTDEFKSSLDGLINYASKLTVVEKAIENIKESLEDVDSIDEANSLYAALNNSYDKKIANITAQNRVIDDALANLQSTLTSNYGQYISFDENDIAQVDFSYINMDANDEFKKAFEEQYNLYEQYREKQIENNDALKEIEKERLEYSEQALDDYVSIQEEVIKILEDNAKEEVDLTKEKYDAMSEADNDYLDALQDALDKQKKMRDEESKWNDLATKEKKLSLMQRDTSGANAKEVASLEQEVQDSRENLLSESIDNVVNELKELYDSQKEARDLEIEYMEEVTENAQYFNQWASEIMGNWNSIEDFQDWFLQNDPDVENMSVEQTEQYMNNLKDDYSKYSKYTALLNNDMTADATQIAAEVDFLYSTVSENISDVGTVSQEVAQRAADDAYQAGVEAQEAAQKAIDAAQDAIVAAEEAYQDAVNKMNDTQTKIDETNAELNKAEEDAANAHKAAMSEMVEASKSGIEEVSTKAMSVILEWSDLDYKNATVDELNEWGRQRGFVDEDNRWVAGYYNAVAQSGRDMSGIERQIAQWKVGYTPVGGSTVIDYFDSLQEAQERYNDFYSQAKGDTSRLSGPTPVYKVAYAKGGLVDYTGPAWVDGTPQRPEAFLNPTDTQRIAQAAQLLSDLPYLGNNFGNSTVSSNVGDTNIQVHINIDSISSDYDVDQMINRVRQEIVSVAQPIGTSVILRK